MPIVSWSPELSVGVDTLDADHRHLVDTINDVFDALLRGSTSSATHKAIADLGCYVKEHFSREEAWMAEHAFPEFEAHQKEHQAFCGHITRLQQLSGQYDEQIAVELLIVLRDWMLGHITNSDRSAIRGSRL